MKNINSIDRFLRLLLGILLLQAAFFWLGGAVRWIAYVAGAIMLVTSVWGFCPLYRLFGIGIRARPGSPYRLLGRLLAFALLLGVAMGGSFASHFFTRKIFLEDFNAMNPFYKQTLFLTGKGERDQAIANYEQLLPAYQKFRTKYTAYQPFALRRDPQLVSDLSSVDAMLQAVSEGVRTGDLHQAHLDLEKVRPVFQELFKRNGFSMLSVSLVDFHDAMERMLEAAHAKDTSQISALYGEVSEKLKAVEAEAQDADIVAIRRNLDELLALSKNGKPDLLPAQAERLKSSFVKVYLQRG
jgi:Protein of unknown function (DUF2892)